MFNSTNKMTQGNEFRQIIMFSLPLVVGNLFQQTYNIVDSIIVGKHFGSDALAAVGATGSMTFLFYSLCLGLSVGAGIMVSQYFGADKHDDVRSAIINSAYVVLGIGLIISILSVIFVKPLLILLDTPDSLIETSASYMKITCGGTIAVALFNWASAMMRSFGNVRTPLFALILANIINISLDIIFVYGFNLGVASVAWATIIAQFISGIFTLVVAFKQIGYFRELKHELRPKFATIIKCLQVGIPISLQNAMIAISMVVLQKVANGFGEIVMAAYTTTMRIEQLVQQPFQSLNAAIATFAAQNVGANRYDRAVRGYFASIKAALAFTGVIMITFLLFSGNVVSLFVNDAEVITLASKALRFACFFYAALGTIHVTRGFLNGVGDTRYALLNGAGEVFGRIVFSFVLLQIGFAHWSVWGTTCLTWLLVAAMGIIRYRRGEWRNRAFVEES